MPVLFGSLLGIAMAAAIAQAQDETIPRRETFTLPAEMKALGKGLEEAGINIVYGPNSVRPPEGISDEAKKVWVNLPQVPLQAHDLKTC